MREMTSKELGKRLPSNGQEFSFVPFTGKREKDIYKALANIKGGAMNQVRVTLAVLLDRVGSVTFTDHSVPKAMEERFKEFDSIGLLFGDAYYMYMMARAVSFTPEMKMSLVCPFCKETTKYTIDTSTFKVRVAESPTDLIKKVTLDEPLNLNGITVNECEVKAITFNPDFYNFDTPTEVQSMVIALHTKFIGYDFPVGSEQVDEFPIGAIRKLYSAVDDVTPGISETLQFLCSGCERTSPYVINWEYPSFFA